MEATTQQPPVLLRRQQVQEITTLSRNSIYRLMGLGEFPKPTHRVGRRCVAWTQDAITEYLDGCTKKKGWS